MTVIKAAQVERLGRGGGVETDTGRTVEHLSADDQMVPG